MRPSILHEQYMNPNDIADKALAFLLQYCRCAALSGHTDETTPRSPRNRVDCVGARRMGADLGTA